jgi:predicted component of type VI protein secretion system
MEKIKRESEKKMDTLMNEFSKRQKDEMDKIMAAYMTSINKQQETINNLNKSLIEAKIAQPAKINTEDILKNILEEVK